MKQQKGDITVISYGMPAFTSLGEISYSTYLLCTSRTSKDSLKYEGQKVKESNRDFGAYNCILQWSLVEVSDFIYLQGIFDIHEIKSS